MGLTKHEEVLILRRLKNDHEKVCILCKRKLDVVCFHYSKTNSDKLDNRCCFCKKAIAQKRREENYLKEFVRGKISECKKKDIPCDLTEEYLKSIWTGICPIYKTELIMRDRNSQLDRIDPKGGYVQGNVAWISGRANRIKYDATAEELRKIADWMEGVTTSRDECNDVESSDSK